MLSISKNLPQYKYSQIHKIIQNSEETIRGTEQTARKFYCDSNYFERIDTEEKAYWIGFIYADGYLSDRKSLSNALGISLKSSDIGHLQKFKKAIGFTGNIHSYKAKGYSNSEYCRISILDNKICADLESKGVYYNKSNILQPPSRDWLPTTLTNHFIRGFVDGNGCITKIYLAKDNSWRWKVSICSTKEMLMFIQDALPIRRHKKLYKRKKNDTNNYSLDIGGNKQVGNVLDYLYREAHTYLDRKFKRKEEYKQYINSRL